jgi:hypothetical protein
MRLARLLLVVGVLSLAGGALRATPILAGLNFADGAKWQLVGVSLHHYRPVAIQAQLGTFVCADTAVLSGLQLAWDLPLFFADVCDYHYALKFYRDGTLVKTLRVNLTCGYVSDGQLSYRLAPDALAELRGHVRRLSWSRIWYRNLDRLREAMDILARAPDAWFYEDYSHFRHDGFFLVGVRGVPLRQNAATVLDSARARVSRQLGADVLVRPYLTTLDTGRTLHYRFAVYCSEAVAESYDATDQITPWVSHLSQTDRLLLVVVGVSERRYWRTVLPRDPEADALARDLDELLER